MTGAIQISSLNGVFSARSSGSDPRRVAKTVARDIKKQLREWKVLRWKKGKALHPERQLLS